MPARWNKKEESRLKKELVQLYVKENKTIGEISKRLNLAQTTVYDRLIRLNIPVCRHKKKNFNKKRSDIKFPSKYSSDLAEIFGILLGDGHISKWQVVVSLGTKEREYARYVSGLFKKVFDVELKFGHREQKRHIDLYIGSVDLRDWFLKGGLVHNKVKAQVAIPTWIFRETAFMRACLRGLIATDGSIYKLRWGLQINFVNRSIPLLESTRELFVRLGFSPSKISQYSIYLTRKIDIDKFYRDVGFANPKHKKKYLSFLKHGRVG